MEPAEVPLGLYRHYTHHLILDALEEAAPVASVDDRNPSQYRYRHHAQTASPAAVTSGELRNSLAFLVS